ncbi:MAG: GTPase Era [Lachnospiraceae bacterium]|nr:GTPase Era [Lachnospiraceae bacterium]
MSETKCGYAAIIGRPNVGKSTLMNHLIGQKIAITSEKPQTTRNRIETVYTDESGQIIFLDTPGMIHETRNKLGEYMMEVSIGTLSDADVVLWLVEPSSYVGEEDKNIIRALGKVKTPVLLVINKIDTLGREAVAHIMDNWKSQYSFADVIPVSGLKAVNLDTLRDAIFKYLPYGPLLYDEETLTDQPMRAIAAEVIREKALRLLSDEIPHGIAVTIERYHEREDGVTEIEASIICEKESHKGIVIGKGGSMLKKIGSAARYDLEKMTGGHVYLKLFVKVRAHWRDNPQMLKNYGYVRKEK